MKYTYHVFENNIYCIRKYAGRAVRGVAKCFSEDTFDFETGRKLSQLRCDVKVSKKHVKRMLERVQKARADLMRAHELMTAANNAYDSALKEAKERTDELIEFERQLKG